MLNPAHQTKIDDVNQGLSEHTQQVLASLGLENIIPSKALMADIKLYDTGKITLDELLAQGLARAKN